MRRRDRCRDCANDEPQSRTSLRPAAPLSLGVRDPAAQASWCPPATIQGQVGNDEGMDLDVRLVKTFAHFLVCRTEMVDPDRGICENQFALILRRGIFFNSGMVPPKDANLRALSRSIRALRASGSNAVFSATPMNSRAMRTRSLSSATIVPIKLKALVIASNDSAFDASPGLGS